MVLFRYTTLRHLRRAAPRTLLTTFGIVLGVALYVAIRLCNESVTASFQSSLSAISGAATLEVIGGEDGFDDTIFDRVLDTPGVQAAAPVLQATVSLDDGGGTSLMILGVDPFSEESFRTNRIARWQVGETRTPTDFDTVLFDPRAVLLTHSFAETHHAAVGSPLRVLYHDRPLTLTVAGLLDPSPLTRAMGGQIAVMDVAAAQWTLGRLGRLDRIDILTPPNADLDAIRVALQAAVPEDVVVQRPARRLAQTEQVLRAFQLNLTALSGIALLVGLFLIYNTMTYALVQRRSEIGLLRALGVTRGRLFRVLALESLAFGTVGGAVGVPLGWGLAHGALGTVSRTVEALYQGIPASTVPLMPALAAEGLGLGCAVALLAGLVPITEALQTVPREVLHVGWVERRAQHRIGSIAAIGVGFFVLALAAARAAPVAGVPLFGYMSALCIVLGGVCLIPAMGVTLGWLVDPLFLRWGWIRARVAGGIMTATPGRTAVAAGALMTALAMMVSVLVMVGSFRHTVEQWIQDTLTADLFVIPAARAATGPRAHFRDDAIIAQIASVPGVVAVDPYRAIPVEYHDRSILVSARDVTIVAQHSAILFQHGDHRQILQALAGGRGVAVSEVLARFSDLTAGETITLPTPNGPMTFPILAVFYDYATDGGRVLMDRSLLQRYWSDHGVTAAAVYLAPDSDANGVRTILSHMLAPDHRVTITTNRELKREVLDIFDHTFAITRSLDVVALVVAILGVANTILTIVIDRRRELGVLRALGATRGDIRRIVVYEAGFIGIVGALLGMVAGYAVSLVLIAVINLQSFGWTIRFRWEFREVLGAAILALAAAMIAGWIPARQASRSPITEVLTDE